MLFRSPDNKIALPVLSVANQSYSGLARLELLQRNWDALPDSLCNAFTTNAIAQLSPEDRFIWVQTLQKLYSVYPNNETYLASVNRHAPFIVFFNTQVSSALSGIALQCLTSIREQMEAYYLQNHIMIQSSIPKDSTRIGSRAAAIQ